MTEMATAIKAARRGCMCFKRVIYIIYCMGVYMYRCTASVAISFASLFASEARVYGIEDVGFVSGVVGAHGTEVLICFEDLAFGAHGIT